MSGLETGRYEYSNLECAGREDGTEGSHNPYKMRVFTPSVYLSLGELRLAVESLEACLVVRRRARDKVGLAEALYKLGVCFVEIGYTAQALDHLQQSLALSQELGYSLGQALALSQVLPCALLLARHDAIMA